MSTTRSLLAKILAAFALQGCIEIGTPIDTSAIDEEAAGRGFEAFSATRTAASGRVIACIACHNFDGSGNIGPDIRGQSEEHLVQHTQGSEPHPVKFPDLTPEDYANISAYLLSTCAEDPVCSDRGIIPGH